MSLSITGRGLAAALLLTMLSAACGRGPRPRATAPASDATIVQGSELSGNLLDGLRSRVNGIVIGAGNTGCPSITFRGGRSTGNPSIFVDGTRMGDTCFMSSMPVNDIDRVEIYRSAGSTPAYAQGNPNGAILIYRTRR